MLSLSLYYSLRASSRGTRIIRHWILQPHKCLESPSRLSISSCFRLKSTLFPVDKIGVRHESAGDAAVAAADDARHCRSFQEFISNACDSLELLGEASQMTFYVEESLSRESARGLLLVNNASRQC